MVERLPDSEIIMLCITSLTHLHLSQSRKYSALNRQLAIFQSQKCQFCFFAESVNKLHWEAQKATQTNFVILY